jgi:hypothetical protein
MRFSVRSMPCASMRSSSFFIGLKIMKYGPVSKRRMSLPSPSFLGLAGRPASAAAGRAWDSLPDGGSIRPLVIDEGGRQDLLGACGFLVAVPTPGLRDFVAVFGKS